MSSRQGGGSVQSDEDIDGTDFTAYRSEMLAMGQATATIPSDGRISSPFTTGMRLLTPIDWLRGRRVALTRITWRAYDSTLLDGGAAAGQDQDTLDAIEASLDTSSDAFAQSRLLMGEVSGWQPNFFRPVFRINSIDLYPSLRSNGQGTGHLADLSIGLPLPVCTEFHNPIDFGSFMSHEVSAWTGQIVPATNTVQRYVLQCVAEFIVL
ncbi:MAG: hypothetical protein ABIR47_03990 [Candidatus Kapaibacterium sp.]